MRELSYCVEGKAANLKTFALDDPGHGGACHSYKIVNPNAKRPTIEELEEILKCDIVSPGHVAMSHGIEIHFQNGPINVDGNGVNGIQHEDLLAIIIDRLAGFQSGPYACHSNKQALDFCRCALDALNDRTRERIARNVEGTHQK